MASLFRWLFACCLGRQADDQENPDERSRLIAPSVDEGVLDPRTRGEGDDGSFDQAKYEERLQDIVVSKKGAMVDVASPFPFNLRNKPRAVIEAMLQENSGGSSSSRSASASTFRDTHPPRYYHPTAPMAAPLHSHSGLASSGNDHHSPSTSRPNSRSSSRAHSPAPLEVEHLEDLPTLSGALGVRLVRNYHASREAATLRRGRSKLQKRVVMRVAGDSSHSAASSSSARSQEAATAEAGPVDDVQDVMTDTDQPSSPASSQGHTSISKTGTLTTGHEDAGPICMSWPE